MKRKFLYFLLCSLALFAFRTNNTSRTTAGTYGVYGEATDYLSVQLNADGSFQYIDATVPSKKISLTGKWTQSGTVVHLQDYKSDGAIFSKWKMDGDCIKSRKGLEWRRLCRVK